MICPACVEFGNALDRARQEGNLAAELARLANQPISECVDFAIVDCVREMWRCSCGAAELLDLDCHCGKQTA